MTVPTKTAIDIAFIPIYAVLAVAAGLTVARHGAGKLAGFINLALFCLFRLVGNALLTGAYFSHTTNTDIYIAGFVLKGSGYSFLLNSALALYSRASVHEATGLKGKTKTPAGILSTISLIALILLTVGYSSYDGFSTGGSNPGSLPTTSKAGDALFVVATVGFTLLVARGLVQPGQSLKNGGDRESFLIIRLLALVSPFLIVRIAYSTYLAFSKNPLGGNVWAQLVLVNICEVIATVVLLSLGFLTDRARPTTESDSLEAGKDSHTMQMQPPPVSRPAYESSLPSYQQK
ncbi:unnamed protein product [Parajaminaea phylloscopi]